MSSERDRFERATAAFDAANAQDPNTEQVGGILRPKELVYAERMTAMQLRFAPEASEVVRLAVRAQHLERWKVPRSDYPMDRIGYLRWRKRLYRFHADVAGRVMREAGYDDATTARVGALLRKENIKSDPDMQLLEDVVGLVFLESHLAAFVASHAAYDEAKFSDILAKTGRKMSARGRTAALSLIELPEALAPIVRAALGRSDAVDDTSADT
jgi:hypothetical protein